MNRFIAYAAFLMMALCFLGQQSFSQSPIRFFRDTTIRMGSSIAGSVHDKDNYIYIWGDGTGRAGVKVPQVHKIDTTGKEIWSTAKSTLLTEGYIRSAYTDSNFVYAFGVIPIEYYPPAFYLAKIDKASGYVLYKKNMPVLNGFGILEVRDKGEDSMRIVCYSTAQSIYNPNLLPVVSFTINKLNGNASAPVPYGLQTLAPLYIDSNDMAYYYTATDSLIKYDIAQKSIVWGNKAYHPGTFSYRPPSTLRKENNKIYMFGDRYCRQVDDNTGSTVWNLKMASRWGSESLPSDIVFKNDSLYTTWLNPYSGGYDDYGHFSKINKNNGTPYIDGSISAGGGISYDSLGYFKSYKVLVDDQADIYLFGHYYNDISGQRVVKKLSWYGSLLSENKLSVDSVTPQKNNVIAGKNYGYATGFLFDNKTSWLYSKFLFYNPNEDPTARITFTTLSNNLDTKTEKFFDNSAYQYASTVVDIKRSGAHTFVLKKQGLNVYLEKYFSSDSLVWRSDLSATCYFTPVAFAIDSLGIICVIGRSFNCTVNTDQHTLTSKFTINRAVYLDPGGTLINSLEINGFVTNTHQPNLIGTENGFFMTYQGGILQLDAATGYSQINTSLAGNFSNAFYNVNSNKIFLTINDADSVYIFSSRLTNSTNAFYHAVSKATLSARQNQLSSSFPQGYLLHAVRSATENDIAYVSGLTGLGGLPTIIKLNYKTNTVTWKYTADKFGEVFKVVQDDAGDVYALLRIADSSRIVKLNPVNGNLVWQYGRYEPDHNSRSVDIDINNTRKIVVAAGLNVVGNTYRSYVVSLSTQTGVMTDNQVLQGDMAEMNFIQAVESMQDSVVMVGGNLNSTLVDGRTGYLLLKGKPISTAACPDNYWLGIVNNNWETPGNWSCGVVPGPASNVFINGGNVVLGSNSTIYTLTVGFGGVLTVSPGVTLTILH